MRPAWSSKPRVRGSFWVMLFITAAGSVGMHTLAMFARHKVDDGWIEAVYRFQADAVPDCEQLAGKAHLPLAERDVDWTRLAGLETSTTVDGRCRVEGRVAM